MLKTPLASYGTALIGVLVAVVTTPASGQQPTLIVENARVIVGEGTVLERGSVIVAGDRNVEVTEEAVAAGNARRIDATGETVLPGLIDANVHLVMTVPGPEGQPRSEEELAARIRSELPVHIHVVDAGLAVQALEWGADRLDHVLAPASGEAADAFVEAMRAQRASAATLGAAAHIGRAEELGTLEPGKVADLIVVDGNPLEDLSMLWRTEFVVKEGEVVVIN